MNGYEIAKKYGITVINHSLFLECDEMCVCGHHASSHKYQGSAGYCEACDPGKRLYGGAYAHNFTPRDARNFGGAMVPTNIVTKKAGESDEDGYNTT